MAVTKVAAAIAAFLLTATPIAAFGSEIKVAINPDIRSIDPGVNRDDNSDAVVLHVVEGLVAYSEDTTVKPLLAEAVDISSDQLSYTFKLRKGVTFHNGVPLTSADVMWSWQRYMDPKTEWRCRTDLDGSGRIKVKSVEAPNPETVVFRINQPSALFLSTLARPDCGMTGIMHRDSVNADGSFDKPIGTGPFRFAEWKRGEYIRLTGFENYANRQGGPDGYTGSKRSLVDEVRFLIIPDSSTAKAALLSNSVDLLVGLTDADTVELKKNADIKVSVSPGMGMLGLLLQTKDGVFSNLLMRQAVASAIDTGQVVEGITEGLVKANASIVPAASPYFTDVEAQGHHYDPERTRQLLSQAKYHGEPITILAHRQSPAVYAAAITAQAMMQAAGINANVEVLEAATHLDRYNKGNYQMMAFAYSARLDPALGYEAVTGVKAKQPRKVWDSAEALALIDKATIVADRGERQTIFDSLHKRFIDDVPMIMLYNWADTAASTKRVEGYRTWAASKPRLWEVRLSE